MNLFKKIKLYGSNKQFYLIEYDFQDGPTAGFPWKQQFIFDATGKFIKALSEMRVDIVNIFPKENSFLIGVSATGQGNGGHAVYRINSDTIEQIYDGFLGYRPETYDDNEDGDINEPNEFRYRILDVNKDGYNDIVFFGKVRYAKFDLGERDKIIFAKYVFLYNKNKEHFIEQEDYSKKYEFIYGNTK